VAYDEGKWGRRVPIVGEQQKYDNFFINVKGHPFFA